MTKPSIRACMAALAFAATALAPAARSAARPALLPLETKHVEVVDAPETYVDGEIIVRYRDGAAKRVEDRQAVRASVGATLERELLALDSIETLRLEPGASTDDAIARLEADPRVLYAERNAVWTSFGLPDDPYFDSEWGLDNTGQTIDDYPGGLAGVDVDAPQAWDLHTGNGQVVVAILDEGLDVTHPDLAPNVWTNPGEIAGNGVDDDRNGYVDDVNGWDFLSGNATVYDGAGDVTNSTDFHGTHTGGTVGAVGNNGVGVSGVCWNVKLMSLKFLSSRGGSTDGAIAGLDYVLEQKRRGVNVRAVNASWGGGPYSSALRDAIAAIGAEGVLFCSAAGNGGSDHLGDDNDRVAVYPSSYDLPNIVSVGAGTRYDLVADYSNFGSTSVDLLAPGSFVASTGPNGHYYFSDGTSMAAPHVTGAVALIASAAPSLTGAEIKEILLATTTPVAGARCLSGGRLNVATALRAALVRVGEDPGEDPGEPPPPPPPPPAPEIVDARFVGKKKTLLVTGHRFNLDTSVIEIDGVAMPVTRYLFRYILPDGTYSALEGKAPGRINFVVPNNKPVSITVYDAGTGQRSEPFTFTR